MKLPLALLAHIRIGFPFRTRLEPDPDGTAGVVQVKDLSGGVLDKPAQNSLTTVHLNRVNPDHLLRNGDVLVRSRGLSCDATLVSEADRPLVAAAPILVVTPRKDTSEAQQEAIRQHSDWEKFPVPSLNPPYLHWFLNEPDTQALLATLRTGTSTPKLDKAKLAQLPVSLPIGYVQELILEAAELAAKEQSLQQRLLEATATQARRELMQYAVNSDPLFLYRKGEALDALCQEVCQEENEPEENEWDEPSEDAYNMWANELSKDDYNMGDDEPPSKVKW